MATPRQIRVDGVTHHTPVGTGEIAVLLQRPSNSIHKWRSDPAKHDPFPRPQATSVAGGPWWYWGDVFDWAERTDRLPKSIEMPQPKAVAS